jgi:hypothetical protein
MVEQYRVSVSILFATVLIMVGCGGGGGGRSGSSAVSAPAASVANSGQSESGSVTESNAVEMQSLDSEGGESDSSEADSNEEDSSTAQEPDNHAPVAGESTASLPDWEVFEGVLPGSDPDGDALRFEVSRSFVPFQITDASTGAYRYDPLRSQKSGEVEYRVYDEHGLVGLGSITFLHATDPVVADGECPAPAFGFPEPVAGVWTHPDENLLFVGFGEEGVYNVRRYKIVQLGASYRPIELEELAIGPVLGAANKLLIDPDDLSAMYALVDRRTIRVSRDFGHTFDAIELSEDVEDLVVTGGQHPYLWAVTATGIWRAPKHSLRFERVQAFGAIELSGDYSIAVHPSRPARLLVVGADGTYRTDDGGDSWELVMQAPVQQLIIDPHNPSRIYGSHNSAVYLTSDFGENWTYQGQYVGASDLLVADPFRPGRLYTGPWDDFRGLWVSNSEGADFRSEDGLAEQVKAIAFTSTGAMYVSQGNRLICRPQFELPTLDLDHPLGVELAFEGSAGDPISQVPVFDTVTARFTVTNRTGQAMANVRLEAWLEAPTGRVRVYSETALTIPSSGLERTLDLPVPQFTGRYRLMVTADPATDGPAAAAGWFVATRERVDSGPAVDVGVAVLEMNALRLNYAHPWFPVVTKIGEQRRTVLDVRNQGPDTARNVVVRISTGSRLRIDRYSPVRLGQVLECDSAADALTCRLGDVPVGSVVSIELYVSPLTDLATVPVALSSDTLNSAIVSGGPDLVAELEGPVAFDAGELIEYVVTVTNRGDETAASVRVHGAIGPWPIVTGRTDTGFSDPICALDETAGSRGPLTYTCQTISFLAPGESFQYRLQLATPIHAAGGSVVIGHVVQAIGFPNHDSQLAFELFGGN